MPVEDDVAKEVAQAIALQLYKDAVQPGALIVGQTIEQFYKTMCVAGLQFGTVSRDRIESLFSRALSGIPIERRQPPPPQILGPILEGMRYEPDGTAISDMFENLLRCSMDSSTSPRAHPAFPAIIRSLTSDEAKLLKALHECSLYGDWREAANPYDEDKGVIIPSGLLDCPDQLLFYTLHLSTHQLIIWSTDYSVPEDQFSKSRDALMLAHFGQRFVEAVLPPLKPSGKP